MADELLTSLPEVTSLTRRGATVEVTGTGNVVNAVTSVLAASHIVAQQLRVEQASLEDAFVALTGHHNGHRPSAGLAHAVTQEQEN
jgi:ABC-2 type transport system ATP-binding protein